MRFGLVRAWVEKVTASCCSTCSTAPTASLEIHALYTLFHLIPVASLGSTPFLFPFYG